MIYANVDRAGTVRFEPESGMGDTLECGRHEKERLLRDAVSRISRLAYDGETWIAAAVRDADEDDDKALRGLLEYRRRLRQVIADVEQEWAHEGVG